MELLGKLKEQVSNAKDLKEARKLIEEAGMRLSDEELDTVAGGYETIMIGAGAQHGWGDLVDMGDSLQDIDSANIEMTSLKSFSGTCLAKSLFS